MNEEITTIIDIGKVGFTPKGNYNPNTKYEFLDVIYYQGSSFIVKDECTGVTPKEGDHYMEMSSGIPSGAITAWSGSKENIPDGWHICDGTEGTPNLSGKFILGASSEKTVRSIGGNSSIVLNVNQMPSHTHGVSFNFETDATGEHSHSVSLSDVTVSSGGSHEHTVTQSLSAGSNGAHTHTVAGSSFTATSNGAHSHSICGVSSVSNCTGTYTAGTTRQFLNGINRGSNTTTSAGAHTHSISGTGTAASNGAHTHSISGSAAVASNGAHTHSISGNASAGNAGSHSHSIIGTATIAVNGGSAAIDILPPYYVLCWIMKL